MLEAQAISQRALGEAESEGPVSMLQLVNKAIQMEHQQRETEAALLKEMEDLSELRDKDMALQESGTAVADFEELLAKLERKTETLKKHQTVLKSFHEKTYNLQGALKEKAEADKHAPVSSSLLLQREELQGQAVAQEESGKRMMLATEANEVL